MKCVRGFVGGVLLMQVCAQGAAPVHSAPALASASFEHETELVHFQVSPTGAVERSSEHDQFGAWALKWNCASGRELLVKNVCSLSLEESGSWYGGHFTSSPTFVMSLYNDTPLKGSLRIDFNDELGFDLNLDFRGWRTVWVPFYEMEGNAPPAGNPYEVKSVRFAAPASAKTLWLDDIIFSQYVDDRHQYPGLEVPFVKGGGAHSGDHWMPKIPHWERLSRLAMPCISDVQKEELDEIYARLRTVYFQKAGSLRGANYYRDRFEEEGVFATEGSPIPLELSKQVGVIRYDRALHGEPQYLELRDFGKLMLKLANEHGSTGNVPERAELADLFARASEYYLDQGWAAGSAQGTAHHIGYQTRELQTSFFLMKDALHEHGLLEAIGNSILWQLNFGEMLDPSHLESNLDYYNTQSAFRLMSVFLTNDPSRQAALLKVYSDHLTAALAMTDSKGGFKPDGTAWHHWGHYPAYATGAFDRVPVSIKALSGTSYRIGEPGHANFKRAFMASTIYSNPLYWGLGQAGRHPLGGNINKLKDSCLALALSGTPDGEEALDAEVAATYLRLWGEPKDNAVRELFSKYELDTSPPHGHWTFPYAALSVHRRSDWSVNMKGYNRNVWASEIYATDNRYGRYQSSGVVQILPNMTQKEAGYNEPGWDWNHPPGATTIERPFAELEPKKLLVMFKSEETYAGGCALDGDGVWAMKLNEADGYTIDPVKEKMSFPGNLKARKSVFCFGEQLLCLGSGIEADDPDAPVHTTLFQNGVNQRSDAPYCNDAGLLLDPTGNGYRILDGSKAVVVVGEQSSPCNKYSLWTGQGRGGPNQTGNFVTAWIDHGSAPKNATYAYAVYPQIGATDFQSLEKRISEIPSLEILRQDHAAHIVKDPQSQTLAYACFEAGESGEGLLQSVSAPCYVMIRQNAAGLLKVAVSNPDLGQIYNEKLGYYEGPSKEEPVTLKLSGKWKVRGKAEAWTVTEDDFTMLTVKCIEGKSMSVELQENRDQILFEQLDKLAWKPVSRDAGSDDWATHWVLDGEFATIENGSDGMVFSAGPEEWNHAHHSVLWTKDSFKGDVKIEYDYTRIDEVNKWVNILYIQATGKGGEFASDIMKWADYRREPWMEHYFENMKLLHISYAAYGRNDNGVDDDYVRCRRYPKAEDGEFSRTEINPDSFHTGLFRPGKTYHITAIKKGNRLFFNVKGDGQERLYAWESPLISEVTEGRIGLRHMWMKSARYKNFIVSSLE
ncbi:DUF1961 family protein [Tichowtungia aerotolerans]|uniref:DUF1961 family protein n=1 Tax=Tichowtungia aerotolerans TaxID=2697043 RepID=A0A6P1MAI9_9BACT|nr:chondroitinase family polysaccharide lyase [Tichowtungia aerotolerans]QHI69118.1 DUF1961 family protein [Tichowtungia aerotolerans]